MRRLYAQSYYGCSNASGQNQGGYAPGFEGDVFANLVEDVDGGGGEHGVLHVWARVCRNKKAAGFRGWRRAAFGMLQDAGYNIVVIIL